jgi:hypothetical protein
VAYSGRRADLENVLQWLRSNDELQWEDQTRLLFKTVSDLEKMAQARTRHDETGSRSVEPDFFSREANAINVARPELTKMMNAMRSRNRAAAIESGEAALALLPEGT